MEPGGFEDDFAPLQSSNGTTKEDDSFILNDEESPKKNSEGNCLLVLSQLGHLTLDCDNKLV